MRKKRRRMRRRNAGTGSVFNSGTRIIECAQDDIGDTKCQSLAIVAR